MMYAVIFLVYAFIVYSSTFSILVYLVFVGILSILVFLSATVILGKKKVPIGSLDGRIRYF